MSYAEVLIPARPAPPETMKRLSKARLAGYFFLALWALLGIALITMMITNWDNAKFFKFGPRFLHGLWITVKLVGLSFILGAILSIPLAFARMSKNRILKGLTYCYVYLFRGTPLLAQIFMVYYGFPQARGFIDSIGLWWFFRDPFNCGLFAMTLNTAAYQTEIVRGAIQSVHHGQSEAAASLGLHKLVTFYKIILPQALIVALRPYGNEIILLIKSSATVSIITVYDLMGETRYAFSQTYDYQTYLWAAIFYLSIVELMRNGWAHIEAYLTRHLRR
ncbi:MULTISPECIES: ABC transporter permease [Rhizobium]|uniref:Polar amino acid transport system permease protein n=1 Tax=Rhizobium paranaense TaxID=1650438 RepID=A0A7W8XQ95_9HYPH|nr:MULTISPECIES: ABC transporter permease [Rhizobium]MBB5573629.1 polar amino acid transport system permease protein [Rhizobium paranaense]PST62765.1 amino acid ABC transporter permease [Rhizobium sp. SEMIA4064]